MKGKSAFLLSFQSNVKFYPFSECYPKLCFRGNWEIRSKNRHFWSDFTQMYSFRSWQHMDCETLFSRKSTGIKKTRHLFCDFTQMYSSTPLQHVKSNTVFSRQFRGAKGKSRFVVRFFLNVYFYVFTACAMWNCFIEKI